MWQLSLWWLGTLAQNVMLFRAGRWTPATRWIQFGLGVAGLAILYPLIDTVGEALRREPFTKVVANQQLASILARLAPMVLTVAVMIVLATSALRLYRLLRPGDSGRIAGAAKSFF
jgi:hypothetical protein